MSLSKITVLTETTATFLLYLALIPAVFSVVYPAFITFLALAVSVPPRRYPVCDLLLFVSSGRTERIILRLRMLRVVIAPLSDRSCGNGNRFEALKISLLLH